jgi:hypothetical protein
MKTKIYSFLLFCAVLISVQYTNAQQCGARYLDKIFDTVVVHSDVIYSTSNGTTLKLDVYEPKNDTAAMRPLIVLAHGGSFYGGDKAGGGETTVVTLCNNFAKRGYVTASINYRLGDAVQMYLDSGYAITTVLKALSDGKSAIRFFRKDAATTNTYRINPNIIFAGGNSAGAVLYIHSIYVDSIGELPSAMQTIINQNGGFEGNSGNDGYSSELQGLVNCAGGLNVPGFVGPNSKPSVNFQGTADNTVPYNCAYPINGAVHVRLCGLGAFEPLYQQYSINHVSVLFPNAGHCPWEGSAPKMTQVDTTTANFLYSLMCTGAVTSVSDITADANVSVYPNPATDQINVFFSQTGIYSKVQLMDETGRVIEEKNVGNSTLTFSRNNLSSGLYLVRILKADASGITKKVMLQ